MKKSLFKTIEIPEGIDAKLDGTELIIKGPEGENKRNLNKKNLIIKQEGNKIIIGNEISTKREKKLMNTFVAHIKNMVKGVQKKFEYKLKICFSHFPITVEIDGNHAKIKNFLGEKVSRVTKMPEGVDIKVDKGIITVSSINKELAGQAAANFEKITKVRMKDRRIFQDGIFIINKAGREI